MTPLSTPHSPFSPGPGLRSGRELTHAESAALVRQQRRTRALIASGVACAAVALIAFATIARERALSDLESTLAVPPPPPRAPLVPTVPSYSPTGVDADLKAAGALGITEWNALVKAAELESGIDADIKNIAAKNAERDRLAKIEARRVLKAKAAEQKRRIREQLARDGIIGNLATLRSYHR